MQLLKKKEKKPTRNKINEKEKTLFSKWPLLTQHYANFVSFHLQPAFVHALTNPVKELGEMPTYFANNQRTEHPVFGWFKWFLYSSKVHNTNKLPYKKFVYSELYLAKLTSFPATLRDFWREKKRQKMGIEKYKITIWKVSMPLTVKPFQIQILNLLYIKAF